MSPLEHALDELLADPLRHAGAAGPPVGYVGTDIPIDLLLATGRPAVHLPWQLDRPTPTADAWIESRFPLWARSMLEDWARGRFDGLGEVVFSRGNDAAQRLYYYVCELQRRGRLAGPPARIFDVAYGPRASSERHTERALRELARQLAVDAASLAGGIERANRQRALFARLEDGGLVGGTLYGKLLRASLFGDVEPLLASHALPAPALQRRRVLLAGSMPPEERLHRAVEAGGGVVVAEWNERASARWGERVEIAGSDPYGVLARQVRASELGPRVFADAAAAVLRCAQRRAVQAVVLWLSDDDEVRVWQVPAQRAALEGAGLPVLVLASRAGHGGDGAAQEIRMFIEGLAR